MRNMGLMIGFQTKLMDDGLIGQHIPHVRGLFQETSRFYHPMSTFNQSENLFFFYLLSVLFSLFVFLIPAIHFSLFHSFIHPILFLPHQKKSTSVLGLANSFRKHIIPLGQSCNFSMTLHYRGGIPQALQTEPTHLY